MPLLRFTAFLVLYRFLPKRRRIFHGLYWCLQ